LMIYQSAY